MLVFYADDFFFFFLPLINYFLTISRIHGFGAFCDLAACGVFMENLLLKSSPFLGHAKPTLKGSHNTDKYAKSEHSEVLVE